MNGAGRRASARAGRTAFAIALALVPSAPAVLLPSGVALGASPQACGTRGEILAELTKRYGEASIASGLANSGVMVEVLRSAGGATWTIIVTTPDGFACLVAAGRDWQEAKPTSPPAAAPPPAPALPFDPNVGDGT